MRITQRVVSLGVLLAALCVPLAAQSTKPIYLYSLDGIGGTVPALHGFSMNPTNGVLSEVPDSPFAVGEQIGYPLAIVVDPTGRFVYVMNSNSNDISGFSVSPSTGTLTALPGSPYQTGNNPTAIAIDPTGRFLYVSTYTVADSALQASDVNVYSIDSVSGVLTSAAGSPFPQSNIITSITFDPMGNYVFLAQVLSDPLPLLIDSVDFASGALENIGSASSSKDQIYLTAMAPSGNFLYTTYPNFPTSVVGAFALDSAQGSLQEISGSPYPVGPNASDLAFDPLGKFLYAVNENYLYQTENPPSEYDGSISAFTIDSGTGTLTPIPGSPFLADINPYSMVVDPTDQFAYVATSIYTTGYSSYATILGFSLNASTGVLTPFPAAAYTDPLNSYGYQLAVSYGPATSSNPFPLISSISPSSVTAGSAGFKLQVNGVNFVQGAVVYFGGQARTTTFVSSTQLNAQILASDIVAGGTGVVFVFNPLPGGGDSASIGLSVFNPAPILSSLSPISVAAGSTGFTLTLNGSNFIGTSVVSFGSSLLPTTYVSSTQLSATIATSLLTSQETVNVTVTNPANGGTGGGTSDQATFTVLPSAVLPVLGTLIPASVTAGGPAFTLTVTGSGFTTSSIVSFNLNNEVTTYVSSTELQVAIPASAIAVSGSPFVIVTNPGVGVSLIATFVVNNPPPGGGGVSPPSLPAGNAALTLNITGTNFTPSSVVLVNGSPRVTTYISPTILQATLLPSDLAHGGTLDITVSNPPPGGGTTAAISFAVSDYTVSGPTATPSVTAGQPANFILTVSPSNGAFPNPVMFTASGLPTGATATFSNSGTVTPGSMPVTVTLSISTTARSTILPKESPREPERWPFPYGIGAGLTLLMLMTMCLSGSVGRIRRAVPQVLLASFLLMAAGLVACGGSGATGAASSVQTPANPAAGTPAGTYSILVTATSGSVAHTTTVTLTVM